MLAIRSSTRRSGRAHAGPRRHDEGHAIFSDALQQWQRRHDTLQYAKQNPFVANNVATGAYLLVLERM